MKRRLAAIAAALAALAPAGCGAHSPVFFGPEITLAFGGDVHFEGRVATLLARPERTFGPAARELSTADLAMVNLETPVTGRGRPEPKRYRFRAPAPAVTALHAAGIDAVSLANNHSLDYGPVGLSDTMAAAQRGGVATVGAGRNASEAFRPLRRTIRGARVAVFAFSQVDDLAEEWAATPDRPGLAMASDTARVADALRAARADSDLVVVFVHWGVEGDRCPDRRQRDFARLLADAGADVVVGSHAHVLQGAGRLGNAYVAYGLGNLLWYTSGLFAPYSARAGILRLTLRGRTVVRAQLVPTVESGTGQPELVTGWRADLARGNFADLRRCSGLAAD